MKNDRSIRTAAKATGLIAALITVTAAPDADAQVLARFALRLEGGAGMMISEHQRTTLGFDGVAIQGSARLAVSGYASPATTGRLHLDAGLGFEFQVARAFAIGPVVRYGHVFQTNDYARSSRWRQFDPNAGDAQWIAGGISLTFPERGGPRGGPARRRRRRRDRRQRPVPRPRRRAPTPTRTRAGCPLTDTDGDGVYDTEDQCVNVPAGAHPDPARFGCPLRDQDNDGVPTARTSAPPAPGRHPRPRPPRLPLG
jgi:hypothetical protein